MICGTALAGHALHDGSPSFDTKPGRQGTHSDQPRKGSTAKFLTNGAHGMQMPRVGGLLVIAALISGDTMPSKKAGNGCSAFMSQYIRVPGTAHE